jgi:hypothetical protein
MKKGEGHRGERKRRERENRERERKRRERERGLLAVATAGGFNKQHCQIGQKI